MIATDSDVPHRPGAQRLFRDEPFLYKHAIFLKDLDPIVLAITDIEKIVTRELGTMDGIPERRRWSPG